MKKVALAGSTGSIGCNSLEIIRNNPDKIKLVSISAGKNWQKLVEQAIEFKPEFVAIADESAYQNVKQALVPIGIKVGAGQAAVEEAACYSQANTLIAAIVGAAGLKPVMRAIEAGMDICLANKETLVVAGELVTRAVAQKKIALIPVDSEHSAIFQSMGTDGQFLAKLIITASGGPFRNHSVEDMLDITPEQALKHPNWNMGGKITIDSATLMNKGLEVIEAHWLFNVDYQQIEVVVHPQSIIHSLVEFTDGSVLAQLGWPDMKLPIQYALSYPQRWGRAVSPLDLVKVGSMTFEKPDYERFPCLSLAFNAGKTGGIMPCVLNAANEIAVLGFLQKRTGFTRIAEIVEKTMGRFAFEPSKSIEHLLQIDFEARKYAEEILESLN
jgi:1-deoxy-D-xylulose-5-phosphate reductoisomerase